MSLYMSFSRNYWYTFQRKKRNCFPKDVESPVGKTMLLKLRLNGYNQGHPYSGVSVSQYVECDDGGGENNSQVSVLQISMVFSFLL